MSKRISLKNMLAEAFYYDVGTEKNEFESAVASATEAAKKKFEDSMKEKVINQKVKIRASKGQPGQPEKDYIIDKVSSASVDWYWKQYVVVLKDEKNKEYFLKPGFKVEVLSAAAQPGQQTQGAPKETPPGAQKSPTPVPGTAETPAPKGTATPPPMSADRAPKPKPPVAEGEEWSPEEMERYWNSQEKGGKHKFGTDPRAGVEWERDMDPEDRSSSMDDLDDLDEVGGEYKKEWAAEIIGEPIWEFLSNEKQEQARGNPTKAVLPYIKSSKWIGHATGDADDAEKALWSLEIPVADMQPGLDKRELQLAITTALRNSGGAGEQYTRGHADVQQIGRLYHIMVEYMVGVDV